MKQLILAPLIAGLAISCTTPVRVATSPNLPPCCATNLDSVAALSDKSLYQLESTWTNDFSQSFQLSSWRGRPQVVAMFFASCTFACPVIVHDMQRIEAALPESSRVGFALVTIDTEHDTPVALHSYRARVQLPVDQWTLLCGSADDTLELAALLGVKFKREATGQYAHSNLITVLNSEGEIVYQLAGLNQDVGEIVRQIEKATAGL